MKSKNLSIKIIAIISMIAIMFTFIPSKTYAADPISDLFDISFYYFHYLDENGKERSESSYAWGSAEKEKNGIKIEKTGANTINITISAATNPCYVRCKPVLMWVHKADGIFDTTKYTDIEQWYVNKLEETFLLCAIPDYTKDCSISVDVPMKLNLGLTGLLNGGYYEIEFYGEGTIPEQLQFAYKAQTYTIEELEQYMKHEMSDSVAEYYNADSGFRPQTDGFPFCNSDYEGGGGVCAGISSVTTAKYNGYKLDTKYEADGRKYTATSDYAWYEYVYGDASIHDIKLRDTTFLKHNSPSLNKNEDGTANAYPTAYFKDDIESDKAFYSLLQHYHLKNNTATFFKGNSMVLGAKISNLENRWSIIDYVTSYLRQGKAVTVNIAGPGGGHAIVGYKMEQIDEDTFRLYCYDSNFPDDMEKRYKKDVPKTLDTNEDGSYQNVAWRSREVYVEFTKKTVLARNSIAGQREYDVFEFDSSNTSIVANSSNGTISFSLCQGDKVGVFNYGNESNEIIAYRAFPVIQSDKTVQIRTFAYYKSGEVTEITNSANTTVKMDYDFIGWYKIKDSQITLTKKNYAFNNDGTKYIECVVTYDNNADSYGSIQVRIPIA